MSESVADDGQHVLLLDVDDEQWEQEWSDGEALEMDLDGG